MTTKIEKTKKAVQQAIYNKILSYTKEYLQNEKNHDVEPDKLAFLVSKSLSNQLEYELDYMLGEMIEGVKPNGT